jgi:hypothetical protein
MKKGSVRNLKKVSNWFQISKPFLGFVRHLFFFQCGVQFLKPVELILPHCAGTDAQQLALMLHGAHQSKLMFKQNELFNFCFRWFNK